MKIKIETISMIIFVIITETSEKTEKSILLKKRL